MTDSVDNRIVNMQINNKSFLSGVTSTIKSLTSLHSSVDKMGNAEGLNKLGTNVDSIRKKFNLLNVVENATIRTLVYQGVHGAERFVSAFTIDPIIDGFKSYEEQINSTQTIVSNAFAKKTPQAIGATSKALGQLFNYAAQTTYSFSDMTNNIGKFTSALGNGSLKTAVSDIKGIANVGALAGSSTQQVASAMYQLSQAAAAGKVKLQDWNSVVNAGMGGSKFQNALVASATVLGTANAKLIKQAGGFRQSLQSGWITAGVLNKTLGVMAGKYDDATGKTKAYSAAQLQAQGYSAKQAKTLSEMSKNAIESATQVRTLGALGQDLKEEVAGAYSTIFKTLFGTLPTATKMFSVLHTTLENLLTVPIYELNHYLQTWADFGGRTAALKGFVNIWDSLKSVFEAISAAWKNVFPPSSGKWLVTLSKNFESLTAHLKPGLKTFYDMQQVFQSIFNVFKFGINIVKDAAAIFGAFFHIITSSGILGVLGSISKSLLNVINTTGTAASKTKNFNDFINNLGNKGGQLAAKAIDKIKDALADVMHAIASTFSAPSFNGILKIIDATFLGGILLLIRKFVKNGLNISADLSGGMFKSIKGAFGSLQETLEGLQTRLKVDTLMKIAEAVGLLTLSMVALSLIKASRLSSALTAMAVGMGELMATLKILVKTTEEIKPAQIIGTALALDLLAGAVVLLSGAVLILSKMSWSQLAKGLSGVAALLGVLTLAVEPLSKNSKGMISAGLGLISVAVGIDLLVIAVKAFSKMSWSDMAKGLTGVTASLLSLSAAMAVMSKFGASGSGNVLVMASALLILSQALSAFSKLSWAQIGKAMTVLAGSMIILSGGLIAMDQFGKTGALSFAIVSASIVLLTKALESFSKLSWAQIGKAMTVLAGSMIILTTSLVVMSNFGASGSVSLLLAANAIAVLSGALIAFGNMSWAQIGKAMTVLAGSLLVLAGAGILLGPAITGLLGLGVAVGLMGAGLALAGAGVLAFSVGLGALVTIGGAGISIIVSYIHSLVGALPSIAIAAAKAFVAFVAEIGSNAPVIAKAFVQMIGAILDSVNKLIPKFKNLINNMIGAGLSIITHNAGSFANAALTLLDKFLGALDDHMGSIVDRGVDIVVKLVKGLGNGAGKIVDAAGHTILQFLHAIDDAINKYETPIIDEGGKIVADIIKGIVNALNPTQLAKKLGGTISTATGWISKKFHLSWGSPQEAGYGIGQDLISGLANGIMVSKNMAAKAAILTANTTLDGFKGKEGFDTHSPSRVMHEIGKNIGAGLASGILDSIKPVEDAAERLAKVATNSISKTFKDANLTVQWDKAQVAADKAAAKTLKKSHPKEAKALTAQAKKDQKTLTADQKKATSAQNAIDAKATFKAADDQGKADILRTRAENAAKNAEIDREAALKDSAEAVLLRKTDKKRADALVKQAKAETKKANAQADTALKDAALSASEETKALTANAADVQKALNAWKAQQAEAAKPVAEQAADLQKKADQEKKESAAQLALSQKLIDKATAEAATNQKQAKKDIAAANAALQKSETLADSASQDAQSAASLLGTSTDGTTPTAPVINFDALTSAQNTFESYTKGLSDAQQAAVSETPPNITFVQNNTSPESLSASDIYRQTNSLFSRAQRQLVGS